MDRENRFCGEVRRRIEAPGWDLRRPLRIRFLRRAPRRADRRATRNTEERPTETTRISTFQVRLQSAMGVARSARRGCIKFLWRNWGKWVAWRESLRRHEAMTRSLPEPQTEFQRQAMERVYLLACEMEAVSAAAPDGQVIHQLEKLLLTQGRDFQRQLLEDKMQYTADEVVKKGGPHEPVRAVRRDGTKDRRREPS
jgi:hypothetical protein